MQCNLHSAKERKNYSVQFSFKLSIDLNYKIYLEVNSPFISKRLSQKA